jgi:hypothetical protein
MILVITSNINPLINFYGTIDSGVWTNYIMSNVTETGLVFEKVGVRSPGGFGEIGHIDCKLVTHAIFDYRKNIGGTLRKKEINMTNSQKHEAHDQQQRRTSNYLKEAKHYVSHFAIANIKTTNELNS